MASSSEGKARRGRREAEGGSGLPRVAAVILAAGQSKRMGQPKQMLKLGRTTILERTVRNYLESRASEVIVVLGYRAQEISRTLSGLAVRLVQNPDYSRGMASSIASGSRAVGEAEAVMVALAEQPFTGPETINRLIDVFAGGDRGIVVPVFRGRRGHPVVFAASYRAQLESLRGDTGARTIVARHPGDILEVDVESDSILADMDTIEDYLQQVRRHEGNHEEGQWIEA